MTDHSTTQLQFASLKGKKITARFDEPRVSSDGGVLYLREVDRQIGLSDVLASAIEDRRQQSHISHQMGELLRQRAYQISCGYEDADDCDHLRTDPALKTAVGRDPQEDRDLGSQPTMTRLENAVTVRDLLRLGYVFEDEYCFMPFHVYKGLSGKYITSVLRAGKMPTAGYHQSASTDPDEWTREADGVRKRRQLPPIEESSPSVGPRRAHERRKPKNKDEKSQNTLS